MPGQVLESYYLTPKLVGAAIKLNPIWIMRQAGRYLPEFREIRAQNTEFIKLCLNESLSTEITLQPIKRTLSPPNSNRRNVHCDLLR